MQVVLGRWSLQDDVVVGLQSPKIAKHHTQSLTNSIGCLTNLLPIKAVLNKSVTFCLLVNRVGEELAAGQHHAMLPTFQMVEGKQQVCQASLSLVPLASECCSGFAAQEVLRQVQLHYLFCHLKPSAHGRQCDPCGRHWRLIHHTRWMHARISP